MIDCGCRRSDDCDSACASFISDKSRVVDLCACGAVPGQGQCGACHYVRCMKRQDTMQDHVRYDANEHLPHDLMATDYQAEKYTGIMPMVVTCDSGVRLNMHIMDMK